MHDGTSMWQWGFGFGHWGVGILLWTLVILGIVVLAKSLLGK